MGIFDEIKEKVDLGGYVAANYGVKVVKCGKSRRLNPCPMCGFDDACTLSPKTGFQRFYCFHASCGEKGDLVDIVARKEGLGAKDAADQIKRKAGI